MTVEAGGTLSAGAAYSQEAGGTALRGGTLVAEQIAIGSGSTLEGWGVLRGAVVNAGLVHVGGAGRAGTLIIDGDYFQVADATLVVELGGLEPGTEHDQLRISGRATLDGTLTVLLLDGYVPELGDAFAVLTCVALEGGFALLDGDGLLFEPVYDPTGLTLVRN